jgi:hypothetical protein
LARARDPCARALAVPLEHLSSPGRAIARRRWYRPAREPLPPEPGRLVVCALLSRARLARGCRTPGDDRLETRAYAVKRYLFRLGHAARSGRFACSVEQLVVGLAPVMAWGVVPSSGHERARFVRAHRKSVQRWLDDIQAAGLVAHEPERDARGCWWRTQVVLLSAPPPTAEELRIAQRRAQGWRVRERARRRQQRRACALATIRSRASEPRRSTRRRLARVRAEAARDARRRCRVEAQILIARALSQDCGLLTHPFGAPPTSADVLDYSKRHQTAQTPHGYGPAATRSVQTLKMTPRSAAGTGAHARAASSAALTTTPAGSEQRSEEIRHMPPGDYEALVLRRVAERERRLAVRAAFRREHVLRRSREVISWPQGRTCPVGRLAEAWATQRNGADAVANRGPAAGGLRSPELARRAARAIALYEAFADQRPPGWPETGAAAICALAGQRRAAVIAGDIGRLMALANGMRASALSASAERFERAAARARRRQLSSEGGVAFRTGRTRWESAEQRRVRVRDELLLVGADPAAWPNSALAMQMLGRGGSHTVGPALVGPDPHVELDGVGARAARYRAELVSGRWALPVKATGPDHQTTPTPAGSKPATSRV